MDSLPHSDPTGSAVADLTKLKVRITPASPTALNVVAYIGRVLVIVVAVLLIVVAVIPIYKMITDARRERKDAIEKEQRDQRMRQAELQQKELAEKRAREQAQREKTLPAQMAQDKERAIQLQKDIQILQILSQDERLAGEIMNAEERFHEAKGEQDRLESERNKAVETQAKLAKDEPEKIAELRKKDQERDDFERSEAAAAILKKDADLRQKLEIARKELNDMRLERSNLLRFLQDQDSVITRAKQATSLRFSELDSREEARARLTKDLLLQQQVEVDEKNRMALFRKTHAVDEKAPIQGPEVTEKRNPPADPTVAGTSPSPPVRQGVDLPFAPNALPNAGQPGTLVSGAPQNSLQNSKNSRKDTGPSPGSPIQNDLRTLPPELKTSIGQFIQLHLQYFEHMKDERMRAQMLADYAPVLKFHGRQGFRRQDIEADRKDYKTFLVPHFTFEGITSISGESVPPYGPVIVVSFKWKAQFNSRPAREHIDTWEIAIIDGRPEIISEASDSD